MATVYRGVYRPTGMPVAIKILNDDCLDDEVLVHRFEQEARIQNILGRRHPGIVTCFEPLSVGDRPAIVLEFVPGESLADILDVDELFDAPEAIEIALQSLDALAYAHHHGVIHRDIKSENLMLTPQGRVKIADFGVARADDEAFLARRTQSRDLVGTVVFMPPEQLESPATVDHRADLYSLGITIYEMVTGELPFDGEEGYLLMKAIETEAPADPREHEPDVPECLAQAILRAIEKDPDDRFGSAGEMSAALRRCQLKLSSRHVPVVARRPAQAGDDPQGFSPTEPVPVAAPQSFGWLEDRSDQLAPGRILLTRAGLKMGRHPDRCDVVIPDGDVAAEHALILPIEPDDVLLIDLDTPQGTRVDGQTISRHRLQDGDQFQLANRWTFVFQR